MRKDEIVSGTKKLEHDREMKEEVTEGGTEKETNSGAGEVVVVVVLDQALGFISVVTGEGGTPLSGLLGC